MCARCNEHFTIHSAKELDSYLKFYRAQGHGIDGLLIEWLNRGYLTNLIYLEYKHGCK